MSIGGLYGIGVSGLNAYQNALNTTGNNITNIYTEGYTRQGASFEERRGLSNGIGVDFSHNQRFFDVFAETDLRANLTSYNSSSTYYDYSSTLDNFLSNDSASVSKSLEDFFSSLHMTLSSPSSTPVRLAFLNEAKTLVGRLQGIDQVLDNQQKQLNISLDAVVNEVNGYSTKIADLNRTIQSASEPPKVLLDERDNLLRKLSELVPMNTVIVNDAANVYLGSGDAIVNGGQHSDLLLKQSPNGGNEMDVYVKGDSFDIRITDGLTSAKLGGMLNFRREVLEPAKTNINHLAMVLSDTVNDQHQKGLDLNGQYGGLFYTDVNATDLVNNRVFANNNNSGSGIFQVSVEQANQTKAAEYSMVMGSASAYSIIRKSDNSTVTSGTFAGFPTDVSFDGLKITVSAGAFAAGDQYTINATESAIRQMELKVSDPKDLALAAPILTKENLGNFGTGKIQYESITDITNASFLTPGQLSPPIRVEFLSSTSYQIVNATTSGVIEGPITYDPIAGADVFPTPGVFDPGYRVSLSGNMQASDKFDILFNNQPVGDNRNGDALARLQTQALVEGATSLQGGYASFVNDVANQTHFADLGQKSAKVLLESAQARRDNFSGVNLDEEASMLLQYQKAYQASAQVVSAADSMFETIIRLAG